MKNECGSPVEASVGMNGHRFRSARVILLACVCGWFIMELEILGVRMLTPYFGSAIYVVTGSVIGIFLLSLSAGYMLGGWASNRRHTACAGDG